MIVTTPQDAQHPWLERKALMTALLIAAALHALIILSISFNDPKPARQLQTIAITLDHQPIKEAIKPAAAIEPPPAKANIAAASPKPASAPVHAATPPAPAPKAVAAPATTKVLTAPAEAVTAPAESMRQPLSAEALQEQISQLGERIRTHQPETNQKVKFANSISSHKYLASQYVRDWENKVERTGNLNYPEAARNRREAQVLTMDVGINADGSIYSMRIVKSSGNPDLDEAAKRIVKMSAPFAELPAELLQEVNVLVITRVWKFSDETGMTSH